MKVINELLNKNHNISLKLKSGRKDNDILTTKCNSLKTKFKKRKSNSERKYFKNFIGKTNFD